MAPVEKIPETALRPLDDPGYGWYIIEASRDFSNVIGEGDDAREIVQHLSPEVLKRKALIQSRASLLQRDTLRSGRRLTWCVALSLARAAYAPALLIRNGGPGGPDCRDKSEESCRCSTHELLPAGAAGRAAAKAALEKIAGKNIENEKLGISGEVSGDSVGKIISSVPLRKCLTLQTPVCRALHGSDSSTD